MYQMNVELNLSAHCKNEDTQKRRPKTWNTDQQKKTHEKLGVNTQKRVPENEDPWKCRPENEDLLSFFILQSALDNLNLKLVNSNLALTWTIKLISPGFPSYITEILPLVTQTLNNSNLPLTRSNFSLPSDYFHKILPLITWTMF